MLATCLPTSDPKVDDRWYDNWKAAALEDRWNDRWKTKVTKPTTPPPPPQVLPPLPPPRRDLYHTDSVGSSSADQAAMALAMLSEHRPCPRPSEVCGGAFSQVRLVVRQASREVRQ